MSDLQNLSTAELMALMRQSQMALKAREDVRAEEFGEVVRGAVEDIILTQGEPNVSPTSGFTGYNERADVMIDGVEYGVTVIVTHKALNEVNKAAAKKRKEAEEAAKTLKKAMALAASKS